MIEVEVSWWEQQTFEGTRVSDALRIHDVGLLFRFLRSRGVSRLEIASHARIAETRVREIANGKQRVTAYCVLERVAEAFHIPRHLMGLSYSAGRRLGPALADTSAGPEADQVGPPGLLARSIVRAAD